MKTSRSDQLEAIKDDYAIDHLIVEEADFCGTIVKISEVKSDWDEAAKKIQQEIESRRGIKELGKYKPKSERRDRDQDRKRESGG